MRPPLHFTLDVLSRSVLPCISIVVASQYSYLCNGSWALSLFFLLFLLPALHSLTPLRRIKTCDFSGFKIHPGHGFLYVRVDSKSFNFINYKSAGYHLRKRNPRVIPWTQVYRKLHKNQSLEDQKKKARRRQIKTQRAIVGASLEAIRAKKATAPTAKPAAATAKAGAERKAKVAGVKKSQKSQKLKAVMAQQKNVSSAKAAGFKGADKKGR
jgi:large subunit ribosomal protein L24e